MLSVLFCVHQDLPATIPTAWAMSGVWISAFPSSDTDLGGGRPRPEEAPGPPIQRLRSMAGVRMTDRRDDAIEGIKSLLEAVDDLEKILDVARGNSRIALASLVEGKPVRDALDAAAASRTRQALTDSLDRFEQFRHNSRRSLIAAGWRRGPPSTASAGPGESPDSWPPAWSRRPGPGPDAPPGACTRRCSPMMRSGPAPCGRQSHIEPSSMRRVTACMPMSSPVTGPVESGSATQLQVR